MLKSGYVRIDRSITRWRWYQNANTCRLFIHLILTANYEDHQFETVTVHRGQLVTSRKSLASALGISEQSVRTALQHLESTGEITSTGTSKFTVITIVNYDEYQLTTSTAANDQPTINRQSTNDQPQCKKDNKDNKEKKEKNNMPKHKHGDYKNVLLTDEDFRRLQEEFPYDFQDRIERLSEYMASTGRSYRNHLATIRAWAKKENGMNRGRMPEEQPVERQQGPIEVLNGLIEVW